eukprot:NODE_2340_length_1208_cov_31.183164_g2226_i0.p1 GENE.NODE_2340_length_1208_cov_31.183164_g2226_i0~~NODE_2340_length_1208_cov_31.183164_g2226_i0.p1  ORF type:complete len:337 (-),score=112.37 NODE_2340_length_1208_cov_31.183164_g2226_i0:198-1154(-)
MLLTFCLCALMGVVVGVRGGVSFLAIGDWGVASLQDTHQHTQRLVAKEMGRVAALHNISFVVNVGDNFYEQGVASTTDPKWKQDFTSIYTHPALQVPWFSALGNHDYILCPQCQVHNTQDARWVMPARYWSRRVLLGGTVHLTLVYLDTTPCVRKYYDDARPTKKNVEAEGCDKQLWWRQTLAGVPPEDWLFVVGHHPAHEVDMQPLANDLQHNRIDAYICGHKHRLRLSKYPTHPTPYILSGAGSLAPEDPEDELDGTHSQHPKHPKQLFDKKQAGFTLHTFSSDFTRLTTQFRSGEGQVLHEFTFQKSQRINSAAG